MDAKMFAVALCLVSLSCAASRFVSYPQEVDQRPCYDYPHCGNVQRNPQATNDHQDNIIYPDDGSYPGDTQQNQVTEAPGIPGYPAGVNPDICPNYPFCGPSPVYAPVSVKGKSSDQAIWSVPATQTPLHVPVAVPQQTSWKAPAPQESWQGPSTRWEKPNTQGSWRGSSSYPQYFTPARANAHNDWDAPSVQQVSWAAPAVVKSQPTSHPQVSQSKWSAPAPHSPATVPVAPFDYSAEGGVRYPADVDPSSCPNYPYCRT